MASIPLPALHVETPQQPDTLGNFQKLLAIKQQQAMAPLQQQEARQAVQTGQLDVQQHQQQLKDQQAMTAAMQGWDGKDYDSLVQGAIKNGASANTVMQIRKTSMEAQKNYSEIIKNNAAAGADQISTKMKQNDLVAGAISNVLGQPDEALPNSLMQTATQLAQQGLLDPQHVQQAQQIAQSGNPAAIRQQLDFFKKGYMADSAQMKAALDQAQQFKDTQQGNEATAQTNKLNQESQFGPSGPAAEAKYRFILNKMKAGTASPEEQAYAKTFEASNTKTTTSSDSLGIKSVNTSGPSGTSMVRGGGGGGAPRTAGTPAMTPGNSLVDEIGQGKMALNRLDTILTRRPELLQAVTAKYPDFDSSKVKSYAATYESFTHGPDAKQVNAGSVAIRHLQELNQLNEDHTAAVRIPGTDAYNRYHNLLDTVADELGTFYGEPKTNEAIASKKSTLGAMLNRSGAIQEQAKAMGVKFDEMEQKWANAAPSKAYQAPMPGMSEKAKQARAALDPEYAQTYQPQAAQAKGGGGGAVSVTDPNGGVHNFPNQAAADKFKQAAGIK